MSNVLIEHQQKKLQDERKYKMSKVQMVNNIHLQIYPQ